MTTPQQLQILRTIDKMDRFSLAEIYQKLIDDCSLSDIDALWILTLICTNYLFTWPIDDFKRYNEYRDFLHEWLKKYDERTTPGLV